MEKRKLWHFPSFRLGIQRLYTQPKLTPLKLIKLEERTSAKFSEHSGISLLSQNCEDKLSSGGEV